jgi:tetratricopeptide (TPR) repeat protein
MKNKIISVLLVVFFSFCSLVFGYYYGSFDYWFDKGYDYYFYKDGSPKPNTDPDVAIDYFTKAIESWKYYDGYKNLAVAYNNRGVAYAHKGDYDRAISDYNEAIRLDPTGECGTGKKGAAYYNRGIAYYYKGDYDKAISDYNEAIRLNPKYDAAYNNRGCAYSDKGDYERAIEEYKKAIELNPEYEYPVGNIGYVYFMQGKLDDALEQLNKALSMKKESPYFNHAYWLKILIYKEKNDVQNLKETLTTAEKYLKEQINKKPNDGSNYSDLAEIYCEANTNIDEAFDLAQKAVELKPDYQSYYVLGFCYFRKGDTKKAIEYLEKSRQLNPSNTWCLYRLGYFYKLSGDTEKAKQIWSEGLKINPNHRFIRREYENLLTK